MIIKLRLSGLSLALFDRLTKDIVMNKFLLYPFVAVMWSISLPANAKWDYMELKDKLGGGTTKSAYTKSLEPFQIGFPYQGKQFATLVIRKHPRHGNDVMLSIERGQILCNSYNECPVVLSYDGGKPVTVKGNEPSDNDSTYVFIPIYKTLLERTKKAKRLAIGVTMYRAGQQVFEFDVSELKWP